MEFNEKLQELRRMRGITQQELAEHLFVSRTAISKWESGRGYPNIESLKAIAKYFSVTVDELISTDEALTIAEADTLRREAQRRDLTFGSLDVSIALLFFLPLFALRGGEMIRCVSLTGLESLPPYLLIAYYISVSLLVLTGILTLALQNCSMPAGGDVKRILSVALGALLVLLFTVSSQPYAAIFAFAQLSIKVLGLIKWH